MTLQTSAYGGFHQWRIPKNRWVIMENHTEMDDLGVVFENNHVGECPQVCRTTCWSQTAMGYALLWLQPWSSTDPTPFLRLIPVAATTEQTKGDSSLSREEQRPEHCGPATTPRTTCRGYPSDRVIGVPPLKIMPWVITEMLLVSEVFKKKITMIHHGLDTADQT